jgi:hypothetical protein
VPVLLLALAAVVPSASAQLAQPTVRTGAVLPANAGSLLLRVTTGQTASGTLRWVLPIASLRVTTIPSGTAASQPVPTVHVGMTLKANGLCTVTASAAPDAPRGTYQVERMDPTSHQWVALPPAALQITVVAVFAVTSLNPNPLRLVPGTLRFTIVGTALDSLDGVRLVLYRSHWILPVTLDPRTTAQVDATVSVPKYLAQGPYYVQMRKKGGDFQETAFAAEANEVKCSAVWTEFYPPLHGFGFRNHGWGDICYTTVLPFHLAYKADSPLCGHDWGLCGGMSLAAGERFRAGRTDTHSLSQSDAKHEIVDDQFRTLNDRTVEKFFAWIYAPDVGHATNPLHSITYLEQQDWNGLIKPVLDSHRPVVLGLIFSKEAALYQQLNPLSVGKVFEQHQVLGIGYDRIGKSTVRITAYDPNLPDDILILTFDVGTPGVKQERDSGKPLPPDRQAVRGVMYVRDLP